MSGNWFQQLVTRLSWAHKALIVNSAKPIIELDNGVSFDLATNTIILKGDFALHCTGDMKLTADGLVSVQHKTF